MDLVQKLLEKVGRVYFVEEVDVIFGTAERFNGGYRTFIEHLRVKDSSKARTNRVLTEVNDVGIPLVEDPQSGVVFFTTHYRRRITYLFGMVLYDKPILEHILEYEDGKKETREIEY